MEAEPRTATIRNYPPELEAEKKVDFAPVVNPTPRALSQEQIAQYNEHGFIPQIQGVYSEAEVVAHREFYDRALEECRRRGHDENAINGYHSKLRTIYELATDPRLLAIVDDLMGGESFSCVMTNYLCKLPHSDKYVPWHQDAVYWPFRTSRIVQIYLAIDDQDEENGAMKMIQGSHKLGKLEWHDTQSDLNDAEGLSRSSWLWQQIDDAEQYGSVFSNNLRAGELSVFTDMTAHHSTPNRSDRRRCSLILRYVPVSVRAFELPDREGDVYKGWNANSIWVKGCDPSGHWANPPPPTEDDFDTLGPLMAESVEEDGLDVVYEKRFKEGDSAQNQKKRGGINGGRAGRRPKM